MVEGRKLLQEERAEGAVVLEIWRMWERKKTFLLSLILQRGARAKTQGPGCFEGQLPFGSGKSDESSGRKDRGSRHIAGVSPGL